jgi:hypothetical protein
MTQSRAFSAEVNTTDRQDRDFEKSLEATTPEQRKGFLKELKSIAETRSKKPPPKSE